MQWASAGARHGLRNCVLGLAAVGAVLTITSDAADARHHRRHHAHFARHVHIARHVARFHRHVRVESYSPPSASIVVDGNTGEVLQASNPDALRHPASLTKVMTLYLLFERLQAGKIKLDTPLKVSAHAAAQAPTKLGLKPGQTIAVEDAIKAVVTRSANDVAVAIAENLGGNEDTFARLMTQKARALGMSRTTYVNASGLPDDDQITTARDQALLGRATEDRFPRYYRYFSTASFVYHGERIRGHNHLLGSMAGVDGIKTGFTRASGFNLVTSVHRDGRYIIGVVLGGRSAFERDAHMRQLIATHIGLAALRRTAPVIAEKAAQKRDTQPVAFAKKFAKEWMSSRADPTVTATTSPRVMVGSSDPIRPLLVKTISYRAVTVRRPALAPMPVLVPVAPPRQRATSQAAVRSQRPAPSPEAPRTVVASAEPMPTALAANPASTRADPAPVESAKAEPAKAEPAKPAPANSAPATRAHAHSGWMIQIGAFADEGEARQHLSDAQLKVHAALAAADPFTERVQKGDKSLYRARFAGFDKATAQSACRQLKRSDFECMALKD
jgi:D-alanyl-D-alanine carboxypeptidase